MHFDYFHQQDSSIVVAFDEIPEDGLNSPLRLEKVANEVLPFHQCNSRIIFYHGAIISTLQKNNQFLVFLKGALIDNYSVEMKIR